MTIPKPKGITVHHRATWAYVAVPFVRGFGQHVEHKQVGDDWKTASSLGPHWLVPMRQQHRTEFRARYTRPSETGEWATGRVWMPEGFETDDIGIEPEPPQNLKASGIGGGLIRVDWRKPPDPATSWRLSWRRESQQRWSFKDIDHDEVEMIGDRCFFTFRGLARYTPYVIELRAVIGGLVSEPAELTALTTAREDDKFGPANPSNGVAHEVTATAAAVSWDQIDSRAVEKWLVGIPGHQSLVAVGDPEYRFTGLKPGTAYTAQVFAIGLDESYADRHIVFPFATKGTSSTGDERPEWIRKVATSTSTVLVVEWGRRGDETLWSVQLDEEPPEYVSGDDTPSFAWGGLPPGSEHTVKVRCQIGGTWLSQDTTTASTFVLAEPQPAHNSEPANTLRKA